MSEREMNAEDPIFRQLAITYRRLNEYTFSNHESRFLRDCLSVVIRSMAGEELDLATTKLGESTLQGAIAGPPASNAPSVTIGGQVLTGGIETAPGVVQYLPQNQQPSHHVVHQGDQPVAIDVQAGLAALGQGVPPGVPQSVPGNGSPSPLPGLPAPVPGSLMDMALNPPKEPSDG